MKLEKTIQKLKTGENLVIVILGDSLTYGWMEEKGYVDILNEMLFLEYPKADYKIINKGIPGDTALGGLHRIKQDVIRYNPDLVIIQFGLNDFYSGYSPEEYYESISAIVRRLKEMTRAEILLITSSSLATDRMNHSVGLFYDKLIKVSSEENVSIAMVNEYWNEKIAGGIPFYSLTQADQVHPTVAGYRLMAEAILPFFQE